jgi:hypothetical protein
MLPPKKITSFKDLVIWQRSELVVQIYQSPQTFPREEIYGITSQIRRAAVAHHLDIAIGSTVELETQLSIALKIKYLQPADHDELVAELTEITHMLYGLRSKMKRSR